MDANYWQEYWDNYYKFMGVYLDTVQERNDNVDLKKEYIEISKLFEPPMTIEEFNESLKNTDERDSIPPEIINIPGTGPQIPNNPQTQHSLPIQGPGPQLPNQYQGGVVPPQGQGQLQPGMIPPPPPFPGGLGPQIPNNQQQYISPGGAQFTIANCRKMAVMRIELRRGFRPSKFYMIVTQTDRRTIRGYRIDCENNKIKFVPIAIEYRSINVIECAI